MVNLRKTQAKTQTQIFFINHDVFSLTKQDSRNKVCFKISNLSGKKKRDKLLGSSKPNSCWVFSNPMAAANLAAIEFKGTQQSFRTQQHLLGSKFLALLPCFALGISNS
ncbi:hypothetical protein SLEP1_g47449 [Rubroshorea leprosula]|uniref:Uncharacterized protein n=1 Tax=Rubroshorea leprosula TaxID=152421 RepID=A0AAV5LSE5_9ROSI|nr:hypothetical protein SLEP1_g47449 [Rubroshorea leprosula]